MPASHMLQARISSQGGAPALRDGHTNKKHTVPSHLRPRHGDQSMQTAAKVVENLFDQITNQDAPPKNQTYQESVGASTQCQGNLADTSRVFGPHNDAIQEDYDVESTGSVGDPTRVWTQQISNLHFVDTTAMGCMPLAVLCRHVLDRNAQEFGLELIHEDEENNSAGDMTPLATKVDNISPDKHKRWDRLKLITNTKASKSSAQPLQMYWSEYARYMSDTALAPTESIISPRATVAKPMKPKNRLGRRHNLSQTSSAIKCLEDAAASILTGAITDIAITFDDDVPPDGFYRVSQSCNGSDIFFGDKKSPVYINVKKESNWDRAAQRPCVTAVIPIFPERNEFVPPGFAIARRRVHVNGKEEMEPANLNRGGKEPVLLCFRRSREGNPVTGLLPIVPCKNESIPEGFTVLEKTPRNHSATLFSHGRPVFLAIRQRLANLETLRPFPLIISVYGSSDYTRRMKCYYTTGGAVTQSKVGRLHIMDRSTHSLLSPSSISSRISLIEKSRRKQYDAIADEELTKEIGYVSSEHAIKEQDAKEDDLASSILLVHGLGNASSLGSHDSDSCNNSGFDLYSINRSMSIGSVSTVNSSAGSAFSEEMVDLRGMQHGGVEGSDNKSMFATQGGQYDLQRCLETMKFIPSVTCDFNENDPNAPASFQRRVSFLAPILTACYTRHGGAAFVAINGLQSLLKEGFFDNDIVDTSDPNSHFTLLDITAQVVCDVAMMGAQQTQLQGCTELIADIVQKTKGVLNCRTVGYILRFYVFVFQCGASIPTKGANPVWGVDPTLDEYLLRDPRKTLSDHLPGGASQLSVLSMKELIVYVARRTHSLALISQSGENNTAGSNDYDVNECSAFNSFIDDLMNQIVEGAVDQVDLANLTQLALHQIHKSGGSELFWHDMIRVCGKGIFSRAKGIHDELKFQYSICFAILGHIIKLCSAKTRTVHTETGSLFTKLPKDMASKLLGLELLHFYLETWSLRNTSYQATASERTFAYCVRRLVVSCLFANTNEALEDSRVHRRVVRIIVLLASVSYFRENMVLEVGFLFHHFLIRPIEMPCNFGALAQGAKETQFTLLEQRIDSITATSEFFRSHANSAIEFFLNFDFHGSLVVNKSSIVSNLLHRMIIALCNTVEDCGAFLATSIRKSKVASQTKDQSVDLTLSLEYARRIRKCATRTIASLADSIASSVAESQGPQFRSIIQSLHQHRQDNITVASPATKREGDKSIMEFWQQAIEKERVEREFNCDGDAAFEELPRTPRSDQDAEHLLRAAGIIKDKGLKQGIDYLLACNVLGGSPRDIASFLQVHNSEIGAKALGRFLGETGLTAEEAEHWRLIRFNFIRANSFSGMSIDEALRHLLTNGGFHLPGEAQQIDRILSTFSQCYWEDNATDKKSCPFKDQDTVFLLAFAIIMLNTDLHLTYAGTSAKGKKSRKLMTKAEFLKNLASIERLSTVEESMLSNIFDSIEKRPIALYTDLNESIDGTESISAATSAAVTADAKSIDALLRGLSTSTFRFMTIERHASRQGIGAHEVVNGVSQQILVQSWHLFHGMINTSIDNGHHDAEGLEVCSRLLHYLLSISVCLDMSVQRSAFLAQLGRMKLFRDHRDGRKNGAAAENSPSNQWYNTLEDLCMRGDDIGKLRALESLKVSSNAEAEKMGRGSRESNEARIAMLDAVSRLENCEYLLNDPSRTFLREGTLVKRANRSGREMEYHFFLFSDALLYAKQNGSKCRVHEELTLMQMKVVDWFPPSKKKESERALQIYHPRKNLLLLCRSREERRSWVDDIRGAIDREVERQVALEAARIAASKRY